MAGILIEHFFWSKIGNSGDMPHGMMGWGFFWVMMFAGLILWILAIYWVYQDAERRGKDGVLWALLVAITMMMGFLLYLILRFSDQEQRSTAVPNSHTTTGTPKMVYCTNCGAKNLPDAQFCSACAALM
ncbi:MAG: zinc ribbon domain-containing protein [Candidatus Hodarchaeota archaeon]